MGVYIFKAITKLYLCVYNWVSVKVKDIIGLPIVTVYNAVIIPEEYESSIV